MAELIVLEFDGINEGDYAKVNAELGINPVTGDGDWPKGLLSHVGGIDDAGHLHVIEVWESQADQADFMNSRLGPALGAAAVTAVPKVTWAHVVGRLTRA